MIGGLWWSLCCDILWFHGAVAGMFETVCCGTMVSAERTACWGLQTVQHSSDVFVAHWGLWWLQTVQHSSDVFVAHWGLWWLQTVQHSSDVFVAHWGLQNVWHDGDCKVHCIVVIVRFMAWWWLQISLLLWLQSSLQCGAYWIYGMMVIAKFTAFKVCWWLQGVLVIAKHLTNWWLQNVWPTSLGKSLLQEAAERIWYFRIVVSD